MIDTADSSKRAIGMMQQIKDYRFGSMRIGDEEFTSDVIIFPDGTVQGNWWRKSGHRLVLKDLQGSLKGGVTHLVVGTGARGRMRVGEDVLAACRCRGIEVLAGPTADAVNQYNRMIGQSAGILACFHLTC